MKFDDIVTQTALRGKHFKAIDQSNRWTHRKIIDQIKLLAYDRTKDDVDMINECFDYSVFWNVYLSEEHDEVVTHNLQSLEC